MIWGGHFKSGGETRAWLPRALLRGVLVALFATWTLASAHAGKKGNDNDDDWKQAMKQAAKAAEQAAKEQEKALKAQEQQQKKIEEQIKQQQEALKETLKKAAAAAAQTQSQYETQSQSQWQTQGQGQNQGEYKSQGQTQYQNQGEYKNQGQYQGQGQGKNEGKTESSGDNHGNSHGDSDNNTNKNADNEGSSGSDSGSNAGSFVEKLQKEYKAWKEGTEKAESSNGKSSGNSDDKTTDGDSQKKWKSDGGSWKNAHDDSDNAANETKSSSGKSSDGGGRSSDDKSKDSDRRQTETATDSSDDDAAIVSKAIASSRSARGTAKDAVITPRDLEKIAGKELVATGLSNAEVVATLKHGLVVDGVEDVAGSTAKIYRFRVPSGMSREEARRMLSRQMPLTKFFPNHAYQIFLGAGGANSTAGGGVGAGAAFATSLIRWTPTLSACTQNVKVGIIDTSFDTSHPALKHLKPESEYFLEGEAPSPYDWHGTAVLSLLGGDPASSTPGLIPNADFYLAAAFRSDKDGSATTDSVRLLAALKWLEQKGVEFVNMSFSGPRDELFEATVQRMRKKGVVFIAAAGNQGPTAPPSYPAAYPDVIAVTAVDRKGESYRHANRGTYIDLSAPGVDVLAAMPNGGQGVKTGTSFAAPFVTAMVASRMSADLRAKPDLLREFVVEDLGPPGPDPIYGRGLALAPSQCGNPPQLSIVSPQFGRALAAPMGVGAR